MSYMKKKYLTECRTLKKKFKAFSTKRRIWWNVIFDEVVFRRNVVHRKIKLQYWLYWPSHQIHRSRQVPFTWGCGERVTILEQAHAKQRKEVSSTKEGSDIHLIVNTSSKLYLQVMHQSFVTMHTPTLHRRGSIRIPGTLIFYQQIPARSGDKQLVKPLLFNLALLYFSYPYFTLHFCNPRYFGTKIPPPTPTTHTHNDAKVKTQYIFPVIPNPPLWLGVRGYKWKDTLPLLKKGQKSD